MASSPTASEVVALRVSGFSQFIGGGAQYSRTNRYFLKTDGTVLLDLPHGGFITVIQSGIFTERRKRGVDQTKPVRIVQYANGRLVAEDPETGWSAELYAFGSDNKAAFKRLLDTK